MLKTLLTIKLIAISIHPQMLNVFLMNSRLMLLVSWLQFRYNFSCSASEAVKKIFSLEYADDVSMQVVLRYALVIQEIENSVNYFYYSIVYCPV